MIAVYGIKACDTCRKALKWLDEHKVAHRFHDLRADGLNPSILDAWIAELGWEKLLNRSSTTWRGLPQDQTEALDQIKATALLLAHPTLIKRPVFDLGPRRLVGFKAAEQQALLASQ